MRKRRERRQNELTNNRVDKKVQQTKNIEKVEGGRWKGGGG